MHCQRSFASDEYLPFGVLGFPQKLFLVAGTRLQFAYSLSSCIDRCVDVVLVGPYFLYLGSDPCV